VAAERLEIGGSTILIHADGDATGGAFMMFEETPPLLDTSLHLHENEDEYIFVLEGEHVFRRGDEELAIGPGEGIFLPRLVPHGHHRVVPGEGRFLGFTAPAGFEGFFRGLAAGLAENPGGGDVYERMSAQYGIRWLDS
jgi:mannose-6-phosphate isomerase-like protein (cupin superfamily)